MARLGRMMDVDPKHYPRHQGVLANVAALVAIHVKEGSPAPRVV